MQGAIAAGTYLAESKVNLLFTVLLDTLLRQVKLQSLAFVDDLKSVADVVKFTSAEIQADIDLVAK